MPAKCARGFDCFSGLQDVVTGGLQNFAGDLADKFFVLDQENHRASGWRLQFRGWGVGSSDSFELPSIATSHGAPPINVKDVAHEVPTHARFARRAMVPLLAGRYRRRCRSREPSRVKAESTRYRFGRNRGANIRNGS